MGYCRGVGRDAKRGQLGGVERQRVREDLSDGLAGEAGDVIVVVRGQVERSGACAVGGGVIDLVCLVLRAARSVAERPAVREGRVYAGDLADEHDDWRAGVDGDLDRVAGLPVRLRRVGDVRAFLVELGFEVTVEVERAPGVDDQADTDAARLVVVDAGDSDCGGEEVQRPIAP